MGQRLLGTTVLAAAVGVIAPACAAPQQPTVTIGQSTITQSGTTTTITQSSNRSSINWQSFSIAPNEQVVFQQPNAASISLDRVIGPSASTIAGSLTANGQVVLINPNGVLFTSGASVNLAGLIATTSDILDSDFAAGKLNFGLASPNAMAGVVNQGAINIASGGYAVLSAAAVSNTGTIRATLGSVVLAGATAFTMDFDGDGLLQYAVTQGVSTSPGTSTLVEQSGSIVADGGQVLLSARAAQGVIQHAINMDGTIEANGVVRSSDGKLMVGAITLDGGTTGAVDITGQIQAMNGGQVAIQGDTISLQGLTNIDISGPNSGLTLTSNGGTTITDISSTGITGVTSVDLTTTGQVTTIAGTISLLSTTGISGPLLNVAPLVTPPVAPPVTPLATVPTPASAAPSVQISSVETLTGANGASVSVRVVTQCFLGSACAPNYATLVAGANGNAVGEVLANAAGAGQDIKSLVTPEQAKLEEAPPSALLAANQSGSSAAPSIVLIPGLLVDQTDSSQTNPSRSP